MGTIPSSPARTSASHQGPSVCQICKRELPWVDPAGPKGHVIGPTTVPHFEFGSLDFGWDLTIVLHKAHAPTQVQVLSIALPQVDPPTADAPILALPVVGFQSAGVSLVNGDEAVRAILGTLHTLRATTRKVNAIEEGGLLMLECSAGIVIPPLPIAHIIEFYYRRD